MSEIKERSAYLAGPMRGLPGLNFPAFFAADDDLTNAGWKIFNPAKNEGDGDFADFMAIDLPAVCTHDCVIVLEGWEKSQGARLETRVAVEIGHPVYAYVSEKWLGVERIPDAYVLDVFATGGPPTACVQAGDIIRDKQTGEAFTVTAYSTTTDTLPADSQARKDTPLASGVLDYFPAALCEVARVSKYGNDKHNPGQDLHWARGKSSDHADALLRHLIDRGGVDPDTGLRHSGELAWRALALLQEELEAAGAPKARGAR